MTEKHTTNGGPAFPTMDAGELDRCPTLTNSGMTLRDYQLAFAEWTIRDRLARISQWRYEFADAMLEAR